MMLCHCRAVTDREVREAIAAGARDPYEIEDRCGAGGDCGSCRVLIEVELDEAGLTPVALSV